MRMLTPRQGAALFAVMAEPGRSIARLAALSFMRLNEILRLRREQLDLAHGLLVLPRTKTVPRQVVLSAEAQAVLVAALRRPSPHGWVFPNPEDRPPRAHLASVPPGGPADRPCERSSVMDLPRSPASCRLGGPQRGVLGAGGEGPRRMEVGGDDAALRRADERDPAHRGGGGRRPRRPCASGVGKRFWQSSWKWAE